MHTEHTAVASSARPPIPRPAHSADAALLAAKVDALAEQVAYLVERQKKSEELLAEMMPIAKEMLATAITRLDDLEKQGYFAFAREAVAVGQRVVSGTSPEDVRAFGDAVMNIIDTVRALTQPEVLAVATEAGKALEGADRVEPLGIVGMVRATGNDDVQKGMAVLLDVLRHVGRATKKLAENQAASPAAQRRQRLAEALGPRAKKRALGIERSAPKSDAVPARATPPAARVAPSVVIDGVAFGADGHLADPKAWTPELGRTLAAAQGVSLTDAHWNVVVTARGDFEENGAAPNIRRLTQITSLATKELYALFPKAPARTVAKIAGIPKPVGCL